MISRRRFLGQASAAALYAATQGGVSFANPLGLPVGIQLYSVRQQLGEDFDGTLAEVAKAGYTEVESAGYYNHSAAEAKQAFAKAGLKCVSAHHPYSDLRKRFDEILAFEKEMGVEYIICASPGAKDPTQKSMTLDDWKWLSEEFNKLGEKTKAVGITLGYHNHTNEFEKLDGGVPYEVLLKVSDPKLVTLELDCGWAVVAGMQPVELMKANPHRFSMFHVKDFKTTAPGRENSKVTELGLGSIDYAPIFAQAKKNQRIRHIFVEQEAFDMPWKESLKMDADYIKKLK